MVKKMCPVCDLPVGLGNYCPRCRKVIRKPYTQNVNYYLNERHPEFESECDFHKAYPESDHHGENPRPVRPVPRPGTGGGSQPAAGSQSAAGSQPAAGNRTTGQTGQIGQRARQRPAGEQGQTSQQNQTVRQGQIGTGNPGTYRTAPGGYGTGSHPGGMGSGQPAGQANRAGRNVLFTVVVTVVVILAAVVANVDSRPKRTPETIEYSESYDYDSEFTDLTDDEVIEAGEECMAYGHFPADGAYVSEQVLDVIQNSDYGYTIDSDEFYSDNYLYQDVSYFESIRSFYLTDLVNRAPEDDYIYQSIDINYDTVTGQIHDYMSYLYDGEASLAYLERFLSAVEESSGIPAEERRTDVIMEKARESVLMGENNYIYEGMFAVSVIKYEDEDYLYIYVSYNDPAGTVALGL